MLGATNTLPLPARATTASACPTWSRGAEGQRGVCTDWVRSSSKPSRCAPRGSRHSATTTGRRAGAPGTGPLQGFVGSFLFVSWFGLPSWAPCVRGGQSHEGGQILSKGVRPLFDLKTQRCLQCHLPPQPSVNAAALRSHPPSQKFLPPGEVGARG